MFCLAVRPAGVWLGGRVSGVLGCYEWPGNDGVMCCVSLLSWLVWVKTEAKRCKMMCAILSSLYVGGVKSVILCKH